MILALRIVAQRLALGAGGVGGRPCELGCSRVECRATIRPWRSRAGIRFAICSPSSSAWTALRRARPAGRRRSICTRRPTHYVVTAELPGLRREDLRDPACATAGSPSPASRRERTPAVRAVSPRRARPRRFSRTFQLPLPVDAERITADLRDGVLTVICPKAADGAARRIDVS